MSGIGERLRNASLQTGYGLDIDKELMDEGWREIERLRAVVTRAKDALLDGQSTQWVHDLLVAALLEPKP